MNPDQPERGEHGVIFSAEMVRALLARRKTQTRRMSKQWMKVKKGDQLWVRENLRRPDGDPWLYGADSQPVMVDAHDETAMLVWAHHKKQDYCPSIHMPRWASRITLEATEDARAEPLQDITEEDAFNEGIDIQIENGVMYPVGFVFARGSYADLWDSLHTKSSELWCENPEVVRLCFKVVQP